MDMEKLTNQELSTIKGGEKDPQKGFWYWNGSEWIWIEYTR